MKKLENGVLVDMTIEEIAEVEQQILLFEEMQLQRLEDTAVNRTAEFIKMKLADGVGETAVAFYIAEVYARDDVVANGIKAWIHNVRQVAKANPRTLFEDIEDPEYTYKDL